MCICMYTTALLCHTLYCTVCCAPALAERGDLERDLEREREWHLLLEPRCYRTNKQTQRRNITKLANKQAGTKKPHISRIIHPYIHTYICMDTVHIYIIRRALPLLPHACVHTCMHNTSPVQTNRQRWYYGRSNKLHATLHTYIHTYIHTNIHSFIYTHTCIQTFIHVTLQFRHKVLRNLRRRPHCVIGIPVHDWNPIKH